MSGFEGTTPMLIDFHAHILPAADHGSNGTETTFKQLAFAKKYGVEGMIATPHFYPEKHEISAYLEMREGCYRHLLHKLKDAGESYPPIRLGAEILMCEGLEQLSRLEELAVRGTKVLLLELPFSYFDMSFATTVAVLKDRGFRPIVAHADRYSPENVREMIAAGAEIQLNADAFCSLFVPSHVKGWVAKGYVAALGSDIHMTDAAAYRRFIKAKERLGDSFAEIAKKSTAIFMEAAE